MDCGSSEQASLGQIGCVFMKLWSVSTIYWISILDPIPNES
jgi:hypothetical protein